MKLTFFLIALALILLRLCYPTLELWHSERGQGTMITKGDNYYEGIWWSGKYRISDDDRSIAEISPGGYLKFRENDTTMKVESDLQGKLHYILDNGQEKLDLNDSGQRFVAVQLQKMIRLGFFGEERAERIYREGGVAALLAELSTIKMEGGRDAYLNRLFKADTLTSSQRLELLRLIDNSSDMGQRQHLLEQFSREQLSDSAVAREWLTVVGHIDASYMKKDLLVKHLDSNLTAGQFNTMLATTSRFESDVDEQDVYKSMLQLPQLRSHDSAYALPWLHAVAQLDQAYMKKDLLLGFIGKEAGADGRSPMSPTLFNKVVVVTSNFGSDVDQQEVYKSLLDLPPMRNYDSAYALPWLFAVGQLDQAYMKKDLLLNFLGNDGAAAGLSPGQFESVLAIAHRAGSDVDEQEIYKRLAEKSANTEAEWISLIHNVGALNEDYMKSELLPKIASKMPRTDEVRTAYKAAAKTIQQDMDYGKVMRALD